MIRDKITGAIVFLGVVVTSFALGCSFRDWQHVCPEKEIVTEYQTKTKTEIAYVPKVVYKDGKEKTDIDIGQIAESVLYLEIYNDENEIIGSASGFLVNDKKTLVTNRP